MRVGQFVLCLALLTIFCAYLVAAQEQNDSKETSKARSKFVIPKILDFGKFKSMFKKSYSSISEELKRQKIFLARAFRAFLSAVGYKHRKKDYYLKINEMSDWTATEFESIMNPALAQSAPSKDIRRATLADLPAAALMEGQRVKRDVSSSNSIVSNSISEKDDSEEDVVYVDHRKFGCIGPVKNQGKCGSCYIFVTTAYYEWNYCKETGNKVTFAEQYALDCGDRKGLKGCGAGKIVGAAEFYGNYGLEKDENYLYRNRSEYCPYNSDTDPDTMGYAKLSDRDGSMCYADAKDMRKFLNYIPLMVAIAVQDDFIEYGGGVHDNTKCIRQYGHGMLLVGTGREDGKEYWLFKNSYGPNWGLDGYYKVNKNGDHCIFDEGRTYFLKPVSRKTVFLGRKNTHYDPTFVQKRYEDIIAGKTIPAKPFMRRKLPPASAVTPKSV